jgi:hypothetical protein
MQRDGHAVGRDVDALDQQPQDARLFGRVLLIPYRLQRPEGFDDVAPLEFGVLSRAVLPAHRGKAPSRCTEWPSVVHAGLARAFDGPPLGSTIDPETEAI